MTVTEGPEHHEDPESSDQPNLVFYLKRKDGSVIVRDTKITFSKHQCLYDLLEGCREGLGFGDNDALEVWYENNLTCLDKMTKLSEIDVKRWLIVTSENIDNSNDLAEAKVAKDAMLTKKSNLSPLTQLDIGSKTPDLTVSGEKKTLTELTEKVVGLTKNQDGTFNNIDHDRDLVESRIKDLLIGVQSNGIEYEIEHIMDWKHSYKKEESFFSEEQRLESHTKEKNVSSLLKANVEASGSVYGVTVSAEADGKSQDSQARGSKTVSSNKSSCGILTQTTYFSVKKCLVKAKVNETVVKQISEYLSELNYSEVGIDQCALDLRIILKKFHRDFDSNVIEGSFRVGGWFRIIATTNSEIDTDFSALQNEASSNISAHVAVGAKGLGYSGSAMTNMEKANIEKDGSENTNKRSECSPTITFESAPANSSNINDLEKKLEFCKNWTHFPTSKEDLTLTTFSDVIERNEKLQVAHAILNYKKCSSIESKRVNCLWEIHKHRNMKHQKVTLTWSLIKMYSNANDLNLAKMNILIEATINSKQQEHSKLNEIVQLCKSTEDAIEGSGNASGTKQVANLFFKITLLQSFLKQFIENRDFEEEKSIIKNQLLKKYYMHIDKIEADLDPVIEDFYENHDHDDEIEVDNVDYEDIDYNEYKNVPLNEIPNKLKKLNSSQRVNYKAALILKYATFEKNGNDYYNEFVRIAKSHNYVDDESRLSFQGNLLKIMPILIDDLQRIINHSVAVGQNIQYTCDPDNWEESEYSTRPFKINVLGIVKEVFDYKATISVNKIEYYNERDDNPYKTYEDYALEELWKSNSMVLFKHYTNWISCQLQNIPLFLLKRVKITSVQIEDVLKPLNVKWADEKYHQVCQKMSYHDLYVDRPFTDLSCLSEKVIIDRLKLRADVFKDTINVESDSEDEFGLDEIDESVDPNEKCETNQQLRPFDILIAILTKSNLSVQQELFRRLHEQRQSVPVLFRLINEPSLVYLKNALMFSKVKYKNEFKNISEDKTLPRAVFLSHRSPGMSESVELASKVFSCLFSSKGCELERFSMMCELTVGFINSKQSQDNLTPWMVLHIRGDYTSTIPYLEEFRPDIIFIEVDPNDTDKKVGFKEPLHGVTKHVISWGTSRESYKYDKSRKLFSGQFNPIADGIEKFLEKIVCREKLKNGDPKTMLKTINAIPSKDNIISHEVIENTIIKLGINNIKEGLILQKSFKKQGEVQRQLQSETDQSIRCDLKSMKSDEERQRSDTAPGHILSQGILKLFCQILLYKDTDLRCVLINSFEAIVDQECSSVIEKEKSNVSKTYETYDNIRKSDADNKEQIQLFEDKYYAAKRTYVEKSLGLENIWRELIYSYEAAPLDYKILPELAAEHLIDGFPLELMDGDTGILCKKWTKNLFNTLHKKTSATFQREAKIFVLSVMGTQSTGKSTLLNIMFGCRMRVSAGQCTKGVYIQLIKSNFENFDYVLILDTEGIRAPEFFGEDWSVWKDNRLATLAILSADATIITTVNENDIAIREVVPIALLAHNRSQIAFEKAGRWSSKLFFAYSRVDTSNLSKFLENRQSLHKTLQDAEKKVSSFGSYIPFLDTFITSEDENESDIKYFGQLNKGNSPPYDKPEFEFGQKIAIFRQYINERTKNRNIQTLADWSNHIQLVYECLESVNFELTFKSACEHQAFSEYEERMNKIKQEIGECFTTAFRRIEDLIIREDPEENRTIKKNLEFYKELLDNDVEQTVNENNEKVSTILEENKFETFKEKRKQGFKMFVESLRADKYDKIKITYDGKFDYSVKKRECQKKIREELTDAFASNVSIKNDEKEQNRLFKDVFEKKLNECKQKYPGMDVRRQVDDIYNMHLDMAQDSDTLFSKQGLKRGLRSLYRTITGKDWSNDTKLGVKLLRLEGEVNGLLEKAKSFDANIVNSIISITRREAKSDMDGNDRARVTAFIKDDIIAKLTITQREWERKHGIPGKLIAEKEVMKKHFKNVICKEIFGKDKAKKQISDGLSHALQKGFLEYFARLIKYTVKDKDWVCDSKVIEAHVDLEYLIMSKGKNVQQLIRQLQCPQTIYKEIVYKKIDEFVTKDKVKEREWGKFKSKVLQSWGISCHEVSRMKVDGYLKMKEVLKEKLFDQDLGVIVWDQIPEETTWDNELNGDLTQKDGSSCNQNFIEIRNEVEEIVKGLSLPGNISVKDYTEKVYAILSEDSCAGTKPRCTAACPQCLLPCTKSLGHYIENDPSSRHDCSHQPGGLVGEHCELTVGYFGKQAYQLKETSCAESVIREDNMIIDGKYIPYTEFDKQFPAWVLPNATGTSRVRKYLFQVHNKAIAEYYGREETSSDKFDSSIRESMLDELIEEVKKKTKE